MVRLATLLAAAALLVSGGMPFGSALSAQQAASGPGSRPVPASIVKAGVQRFLFTDWEGPAIPVWYFRPPSAGADAPFMFVMHGVGRDADRYIGEWVQPARRHGIVVVVPEFSLADFPGARAYNNGGLFGLDGKPAPRGRWAFSALEPIFDAVVAREGLTTSRYVLFGHSAGAQFVHRHVLTGGGPRMERAIAANAGSYLYPTTDIAFPFGVGGLAPGVWDPVRAFAQPLTLLLGTADDDPKHRSLPSQPEAMAQGPHRLARGKGFYAFARKAAGQQQAAFGWSCALAPGVAHDNGRIAPYAVALLLAPGQPPAGADCTAISPVR